jgi:invasion protein IalB
LIRILPVRRTLFRAAAATCLAGLFAAGAALAQQAGTEAQTETGAPGAAPSAAQGGAPKQVLAATHGDWEIQCLEGTETCAMQQVGETPEGKRALLVTIQRLAGVQAEGREVPAAVTVNTPAGVLIPYGVRVRVDDGNTAQVPLLRCLADNCVARAPMSAEAVAELKRGGKATFAIFLEEEVLVDVSLSGFTAAYDALTPVQAGQN